MSAPVVGADATADQLLRRWGTMDAEFQRHASVWRGCFDATYPERADGLQGDMVDAQTAQNRKADLLDSTGTDSARLLTSTVMSGMTPANSLWFGLDVGDEDDDERRWLDGTATTMWNNIHGANFDAVKFECVLDSVCAGWYVMFIDDDDDTGDLMFHQWPLAQCRLASSKPGGIVDTVFRKFRLTAEQAVAEYGDRVSERVKTDARNAPDTTHEFVHAIFPRTKYTPGTKLPRNMPIASMHVECSTKVMVRESGYNEQPFCAPRWMQLPQSPYAIGPVSSALPTIRSLNELLRLEAAGLARAVAGVYVAADDGVLNPRTVRVRPGSVIVANDVNSIRELPSGSDFNAAFSKADSMRAEIRRVLMADQIPPVDSPTKTATEFHYRANLVRTLLGPVFGRFQSEDLAPMIDRVFGLNYRFGRPELGGQPGDKLLDDAPESLTGLPFRVRFQSPLARAQKQDDVTAMQRVNEFAGFLAQLGKPEALDLLAADDQMRIASDGFGAPSGTLKDDKAVAEYRKAQQDQAQQQAQAAQQAEMQTMAAEAAMKRQPAEA